MLLSTPKGPSDLWGHRTRGRSSDRRSTSILGAVERIVATVVAHADELGVREPTMLLMSRLVARRGPVGRILEKLVYAVAGSNRVKV